MDVINCLTGIPADDLNFKAALGRANDNELTNAIEIMESRNGQDKSRISACRRELRKRERFHR